jgi:hypothetical protein
LVSKRGSENHPRDVAVYLVRRLCCLTLPSVGESLLSSYCDNDKANAEDFRGGRFHIGDVKTTLCQDQLSRYKRPKEFFFIDDSDRSRSTTGKIRRHLLEDRLKKSNPDSMSPGHLDWK